MATQFQAVSPGHLGFLKKSNKKFPKKIYVCDSFVPSTCELTHNLAGDLASRSLCSNGKSWPIHVSAELGTVDACYNLVHSKKLWDITCFSTTFEKLEENGFELRRVTNTGMHGLRRNAV